MSRDHEAPHTEWTDRLSDYLAESLGAAEREDVDRHLAECGACRDVLAELRAVVTQAGALPDLEPPRDLWQGIAAAIGGPVRAMARAGDPNVIELPSARAVEPPARRRPGARRIQLAAAAAGLVAVSASTTWWVANARAGSGSAAQAAALPVAAAVTPAAAGSPPAELASQLATLEEVLQVARGSLDPNTVRVLERNLGVIEQAIDDSRQALALDPGNEFLTEHLERMYRRKLLYLQDVVRVVEWAG